MAPEHSHLNFASLKVLVPKLHYCELEPERYPPETPKFIRVLWDYAKHAGDLSLPTEPLDTCIQKRVLKRLSDDFRADEESSPFHIYTKVLAGIECKTCAKGNAICLRDDPHNHDNIDRPGSCLSPIHNLFAVSRDLAEHLYNRYAPPVRYQVHLSTHPTSKEEVTQIPVPYKLDADTVVSHPGWSVVDLTLNPELFDHETYWAMLYAFFHECICHAHQGSISKETGNRGGCGRTDVFGEGWMDFVAHEVLLDFLEARLPQGDFPDLKKLREKIPRPKDFARVGRHFHEQRCNRFASKPNPSADAHWSGELIAQTVKAMFELLELPNPTDLFYALSFGLNALKTNEDGRNKFMATLDQQLTPYVEGNCAKKPSIAKTFTKFARNRNSEQFWRDVLRGGGGFKFSFFT